MIVVLLAKVSSSTGLPETACLDRTVNAIELAFVVVMLGASDAPDVVPTREPFAPNDANPGTTAVNFQCSEACSCLRPGRRRRFHLVVALKNVLVDSILERRNVARNSGSSTRVEVVSLGNYLRLVGDVDTVGHVVLENELDRRFKRQVAEPTIYELVRKKKFPSSFNLIGRKCVWLKSEVEAWKRWRIETAKGSERWQPPAAES